MVDLMQKFLVETEALRLDGAWALTAVRLRWACRVRVLCGRKWGAQYTETKSTVPRDGLLFKYINNSRICSG